MCIKGRHLSPTTTRALIVEIFFFLYTPVPWSSSRQGSRKTKGFVNEFVTMMCVKLLHKEALCFHRTCDDNNNAYLCDIKLTGYWTLASVWNNMSLRRWQFCLSAYVTTRRTLGGVSFFTMTTWIPTCYCVRINT